MRFFLETKRFGSKTSHLVVVDSQRIVERPVLAISKFEWTGRLDLPLKDPVNLLRSSSH